MNITEVYTMATELMTVHNLISNGWKLEIDKAKRRLGYCDDIRKVISLSRYYFHCEESVIRDTILHEIAHAIVGCCHGHNWTWKMKCREIGANPSRAAHGVTSSAKKNFIGICPNCGKVSEAYRRTRVACGACCDKYNFGRFDLRFLLVWKWNTN